MEDLSVSERQRCKTCGQKRVSQSTLGAQLLLSLNVLGRLRGSVEELLGHYQCSKKGPCYLGVKDLLSSLDAHIKLLVFLGAPWEDKHMADLAFEIFGEFDLDEDAFMEEKEDTPPTEEIDILERIEDVTGEPTVEE